MNHVYVDVSDLNAEYNRQFPVLQGLGAGVLSTGPIGSLGLVRPTKALGFGVSYPWKEYSEDTVQLQTLVNQSLKVNGYNQIGVDGKLGPGTCGAVKEMCDLAVAKGGSCTVDVPDTCQAFTKPTKVGTTAPPPTPPKPGPVTPGPATDQLTMGGRDKGTTWLILGGVVAVGAIGAALYFTRKGR